MERLTEGFGLIEGPVWDAQRGLLFSDVTFGGVFCLAPDGTVSSVFEHRRGIGGMAAHEDGGLLVSGRNISYKSFSGTATVTVLDRNEDFGNVGYNDITTDRQGRVYAGSLGSSPVFEDGLEPASGDLYLIDLDGSDRVVARDIQLSNGLAFSPDGSVLYHSDTRRKTVQCYSVAENGSLGDKKVFAKTDRGVPDGLVVSEDGAVWVALAGGGKGVAVFESTGILREYIDIPLPMCTSLCFGGEDLRDLYIVSGPEGSESDRAGSIFKYRSKIPGLPVTTARIKIPS